MKRMKLTHIIIFIVVIAMFISAGIFSINCEFHESEYTVTITDKDRIVESSKDGDGNKETDSKYIVFADDEDGNSLVFENTDTIFHGKFNSSNIQGQLKIGNTYKITVVGYRNTIFQYVSEYH